jgi:lysophospholipase L1-like esterase
MRRMKSNGAQVGALVTGALIVAGSWGVVFTTSPGAGVDIPDQGAQAPLELSNPDADTVVAVLGDSFTEGSEAVPSWLDRLGPQRGWIVGNESIGGTGYTTQRPESFPARAGTVGQWEADLVILAGGRNDESAPPAEVADEARKTLAKVERAVPSADVVLFSPFASGEPTPAGEATSAALRDLADAEGVPYVDVTGFLPPEDVGEDGVHPTAHGQVVLAQRIGAALDRLDLPRSGAYR